MSPMTRGVKARGCCSTSTRPAVSWLRAKNRYPSRSPESVPSSSSCRRRASAVWAAWAGYRRLLQTSGRAPSDYLRMFGPAPVVINAGVNGLIGMAYILLTGGDLNGPTVGGILTIMGFSAFGKHAFNILPVMAGVVLGSVVMDWSLTDSAVQLACLFCTTLAPIAGYFGWGYGVLAGFLHSSVVLYTGSPVAGMNLYNNGFSGGLIATLLFPILSAFFPDKEKKEPAEMP